MLLGCIGFIAKAVLGLPKILLGHAPPERKINTLHGKSRADGRSGQAIRRGIGNS
jgi:hypothetical protein